MPRSIPRTVLAAALTIPLLLPGTAHATSGSSLSSQLSSNLPDTEEPPVNAADNLPEGFDLQSHRGGRGEWTEQSRLAFENSLELGVTTLELDVVITEDGVPLVWHDPTIQADKCDDTAPVTADDPEYPYVGKLVHDLNWEQLQTLDCGKLLPAYPDAEVADGNKLLQLSEVFEIAADHPDVHFNIETKIEAENPADSASPEEFVDTILDEVDAAGVNERTMIQSFDWRTLPLVRERDPRIPLVALWSAGTWAPGTVWSGDVSYEEVDGDPITAAEQLGVEVLSPAHALPETTDAAFLERAHDAGLRVVPWTVNDAERMQTLIDAGVDGIITDYPTTLRDVMADNGLPLP